MGYLLGFIFAILMVVGGPARAGFVDLIQIRGFFRTPSIFLNLRSGAKTWGRLSGRPPSLPPEGLGEAPGLTSTSRPGAHPVVSFDALARNHPLPCARCWLQSDRTSMGRPAHSMHLSRLRSVGISTCPDKCEASTMTLRSDRLNVRRDQVRFARQYGKGGNSCAAC
jgi:hypothetical protein